MTFGIMLLVAAVLFLWKREALERNPAVAVGLGALLLLAALIFAFMPSTDPAHASLAQVQEALAEGLVQQVVKHAPEAGEVCYLIPETLRSSLLEKRYKVIGKHLSKTLKPQGYTVRTQVVADPSLVEFQPGDADSEEADRPDMGVQGQPVAIVSMVGIPEPLNGPNGKPVPVILRITADTKRSAWQLALKKGEIAAAVSDRKVASNGQRASLARSADIFVTRFEIHEAR